MVTSAIFWKRWQVACRGPSSDYTWAWGGGNGTCLALSLSLSNSHSYFSLPALLFQSPHLKGFRWLNGKEFAHQRRRRRFNPWVGKIPW